MAVQTRGTEVPDTFPVIPAVREAERILAEVENPEARSRRKPDAARVCVRYLQRTDEERLAHQGNRRNGHAGFPVRGHEVRSGSGGKKNPRQRFMVEVRPG